MALAPERLDSIAAEAARVFAGGGRLDAAVRAVRAAHPGMTVTGTLASLMTDEPFREEARFSLFLVDGTNHCWTVTAQPAVATGVIIAERDDDE